MYVYPNEIKSYNRDTFEIDSDELGKFPTESLKKGIVRKWETFKMQKAECFLPPNKGTEFTIRPSEAPLTSSPAVHTQRIWAGGATSPGDAQATINQDLDLIKSCIEVPRVAACRAVVCDKDRAGRVSATRIFRLLKGGRRQEEASVGVPGAERRGARMGAAGGDGGDGGRAGFVMSAY
ncbi:hypothetical protein GWI33_005710 [Rhynchophorus ferrugineus]|uniref:Uncharacterized protein n=1 Tax=Rhynchophorus ferrugineus TaxID=354439 RepID=A0A834IK43_RHYFE|nr:hypothetical protein GWI33_005710 [Rhynchophorus ferrugineus]